MKGARPSLMGALLKLGIRKADDGKGMAGSDSVKEENQINLLVGGNGMAGSYSVEEENQTNHRRIRPIRPDFLKEESHETDLLIATIIATVTFTAAFTVPGGYQTQGVDEGLVLFGKSATFGAFLITNTLAFGLSMTSILVHFFASLCDHNAAWHESVARRSSFCIFYAIIAMLVAFISGTYTVVPHYLGITVAVILSFFFFVNMIYHIYVFKYSILGILGMHLCIPARMLSKKCIPARECIP